MKTYWENGGVAPRILNPGPNWRRVIRFTCQPLYTPIVRTPGTHCTGGWVGLRAGLDAVTKRKYPCTCRKSNPERSDLSLVTAMTELPESNYSQYERSHCSVVGNL